MATIVLTLLELMHSSVNREDPRDDASRAQPSTSGNGHTNRRTPQIRGCDGRIGSYVVSQSLLHHPDKVTFRIMCFNAHAFATQSSERMIYESMRAVIAK